MWYAAYQRYIYEDVGTVEGHRGAQGLVFGHVYGKAFFNLQHHPKIHFFATSIQRNHKNMTNILKLWLILIFLNGKCSKLSGEISVNVLFDEDFAMVI